MGNLQKVVYLTEAQAQELFTNGTITVGGVTVTYSADDLYVTPAGDVVDVQINGSSIVNNGVANIPYIGQNTAGVAKTNNAIGLAVNANGELYPYKAPDADIKSASNQYRPIVPYNQHKSVFYGLAKCAGDSTQSSSDNAVGVYTDTAKVAIQKMMGIYEAPFELIREDTFTNAVEANHEVTVDSNGNAFELTDVVLFFELPKQDTASSVKGNFIFYDGNTKKAQGSYNNTTQQANANANGLYMAAENKNGLIYVWQKLVTATTNSGAVNMVYREDFPANTSAIFVDASFKVTKVLISQVTGTGHYKLYGRRKWN